MKKEIIENFLDNYINDIESAFIFQVDPSEDEKDELLEMLSEYKLNITKGGA